MDMRFHKKYKYTICYVLAVFAFGLLVYSDSYNNSKRVYGNALDSCERGKLDRTANVKGWRAASVAAKTDAEAQQYDDVADDLQSRIKACEKLVERKPTWILWNP